jgi:hypothetical protein
LVGGRFRVECPHRGEEEPGFRLAVGLDRGRLGNVEVGDVDHAKVARERLDRRPDDVPHDVADAHRVRPGETVNGVEELELVGETLGGRDLLDRGGCGLGGSGDRGSVAGKRS